MSKKLSNKQFKQIVESASESIIVVDRNGIIIFVNHQVEHYFGYAQDELIDQHMVPLIKLYLKKLIKPCIEQNIPGKIGLFFMNRNIVE
ncbi:MAG: hypothetical protein A3F46_02030 [Legionellales bacterium RIFCSPHIGHO2_12_FULL_42_9]|nr:MAG: hypothetical protein A3F46_02030 [Legionellales bacterium RIFCSPHIGHO2_12_FULL_42_9]